jgi:hypothetical protein
MEAAIASHPSGSRAESESRGLQEWKESDINMIVDNATLRLANTLTTKHQKYQNEYAALPQVANVRFVVAIAPFDQPLF